MHMDLKKCVSLAERHILMIDHHTDDMSVRLVGVCASPSRFRTSRTIASIGFLLAVTSNAQDFATLAIVDLFYVLTGWETQAPR